jgi:hypothetical protein
MQVGDDERGSIFPLLQHNDWSLFCRVHLPHQTGCEFQISQIDSRRLRASLHPDDEEAPALLDARAVAHRLPDSSDQAPEHVLGEGLHRLHVEGVTTRCPAATQYSILALANQAIICTTPLGRAPLGGERAADGAALGRGRGAGRQPTPSPLATARNIELAIAPGCGYTAPCCLSECLDLPFLPESPMAMMKKPTWMSFWLEFPDYGTYPHSPAVKKDIGGSVDAAYITNTCAIRLSRGLNYNGVPLPPKQSELLTVKGGDGRFYALRVAETRKWLQQVFGKPDFDLTKKKGEVFDTSPLDSLKGIIAFDIKFPDATGHLDSWNGNEFSSEYKVTDYWTPATRISLWQLK